MDSRSKLWPKFGITVQLIGGLACCVLMTAHAAQPQSGMDLKLDLSLINAFGPDDCDEEANVLGLSKEFKPKPTPMLAAAQPKASVEPAPVAGAMTTSRAPSAPSPVTERLIVSPATSSTDTPVSAPVTVAVAASDAPRTTPLWDIAPGDRTLNAALARWAVQAGWQLVWELPVDYAVETRTSVSGTFEEAVSAVAQSMDSAEVPMKAIFYAGNKVLRIVPKGVQ